MATAITNITPSSGSIVGPYVTLSVYFGIDPTPHTVYTVDVTATTGVYNAQSLRYQYFAQSMSGGVGGSTSVPFSSLQDGSWTFTAKLYTGYYDPNAADGRMGATTLHSTFTRTLTVKSTISVTQYSPDGGEWVRANYSDPAAPTVHQQLFEWFFGSDGAADYQNGWTVEVRRNDTQAAVGTFNSSSGNEGSTSNIIGIANTYKDILLEWRVRLTNRYGTVSPYSAWSTFGFATPPVSTITTPANNAALTSGVINIVTSATTTGGRTVNKTEASIYQGTTLIWSRVATNVLASGANLTINDSTFILPQSGGVPYTLRVKHTDSLGIESTEISRNFTVTYTTPPGAGAPTVSAANYDSSGYITVQWNNTGVDASFYAWVVERRERPLDPYTDAQIGSFGSWTEVGRVYVNGTNFTYQDYTAPAQSYLEYRVKQVVIRDSYQVTSTTATAGTGVSAITSSYWLVSLSTVTTGTTTVTTVAGTALKLWNVTGDQFKRERARNEFNLIGRGRYIEEGDLLGFSGTFNAQLRDSGTTNARTKRLDLQAFQDSSSRFEFRNPFGDSFSIAIGDIDITRIPGTGKSEFVDITVPYWEVS